MLRARLSVVFLALLSLMMPVVVQAAQAPQFVPDYPGHLGVDIQSPGPVQQDTPVLWNGPPAEVIFMGPVSKTVDDRIADDKNGDGYGTMLVKLRVHLPKATEFPTEVSMPDLLQEMVHGNITKALQSQDTLPGLERLLTAPRLPSRVRPYLRAYTKATSTDKATIESKVANLLGIETHVTTDTIDVLVGHLRPSQVFVESSDPVTRFKVGMEQGNLKYHVGSVIATNTLLGFMERDHFEGSSTAPHVHFGAYVPSRLRNSAWGFRGRGVASTSAIREAYVEAESTLRILAGFATTSLPK